MPVSVSLREPFSFKLPHWVTLVFQQKLGDQRKGLETVGLFQLGDAEKTGQLFEKATQSSDSNGVSNESSVT